MSIEDVAEGHRKAKYCRKDDRRMAEDHTDHESDNDGMEHGIIAWSRGHPATKANSIIGKRSVRVTILSERDYVRGRVPGGEQDCKK